MVIDSDHLVVMLDPRGIVGRGSFAVVARHNEYSILLRERSKNQSSLVILTVAPPAKFLKPSPATIVAFPSILTWVFGSIRFLFGNRKRISVFVSGTPWETFWVTWFLRFLSHTKARLQVQFHGDFFDSGWRSSSWLNNLRFRTLPCVLNLSDGIRFVGEIQYMKALELFPQIRDKSVVLPIPLSLGEFKAQGFDPGRHFTLGFIGRLHVDKGTDDFLRLIRCLIVSKFTFSVLVAGEGPERHHLQKSLESLGVQFELTGHVTGVALESVWDSIDLVASLAPLESYGLVPREAMARGKRVIAIASGGIDELAGEIPEQTGLEILPEDWDCFAVKRSIERLKAHRPTPLVQELLAKRANDSLEGLVASWL